MQESEIVEKLRDIFKLVISNNKVDADTIKMESNINTDLGLDSVGLVYMVIAIEKTFNIDMGDATFNTFKTVSDVVTYIQERVK